MCARQQHDNPTLPQRLWRSVVSGPFWPASDRERKSIVFNNFILHFRPVTLPRATLRYTHTFGLGGMSLVLFSLLVGTGVLLMFAYEPSPERAHASIQTIENSQLLGGFVRGVHHWSANLLIVVMLLHLLRVYFTGGYLGSRQFNWVIGLLLLLGVLISNLTGYLLPWDQLAYWATIIVTGMVAYVPAIGGALQRVALGGTDVTASTLIIFYTIHTTVMPVLLVALMVWHFWRVRRARGVVVPRGPEQQPERAPERTLVLPHLFVRELAVGLCLAAVVAMLAVFAGAPLGDAANSGMSPNPAKAPWYFVGFQELLLHFHPLFAVFVIPLMAAVALVLLPYIRYDTDFAGVFMVSRRGRRMVGVAAIAAVVLTPLWIIFDEYVLNPSGGTSLLMGGLLPCLAVTAAIAGAYVALRRSMRATRGEAVQACFIFVLTAFLVLTVVGVWFRGPGMALGWFG